jgi:ATP-binding cassette, subfamily C (CFTR/MRP), member 1
LADWLVVLGDASIKYQGTWADLKEKPENILKAHVAETDNNSAEEKHPVNEAVQSKRLDMAEAVSDLSRATGDISLYGNAVTQTHGMFY